MVKLLKAVKKRPGCSQAQIDRESVLLRAYGKGTDVIIDRESKRLMVDRDANLSLTLHPQEKHAPIRCWPVVALHHHSWQDLPTDCSTNSLRAMYAAPRTSGNHTYTVPWPGGWVNGTAPCQYLQSVL